MGNNTNTILAVLTCVVIFFLIFEMSVNNQNVNRLSTPIPVIPIPAIPIPAIPIPIPIPTPPIPTPSENITVNLSNGRRNNNNNNIPSIPAPVTYVPTTRYIPTPTPPTAPAPATLTLPATLTHPIAPVPNVPLVPLVPTFPPTEEGTDCDCVTNQPDQEGCSGRCEELPHVSGLDYGVGCSSRETVNHCAYAGGHGLNRVCQWVNRCPIQDTCSGITDRSECENIHGCSCSV